MYIEHDRKTFRLAGFDYTSAGAYFVTICTNQRANLFGKIVDGKMVLNELGQIVVSAWTWLQEHHSFVELDEYVVMPDHFHGIIWFVDPHRRGGSRTAPTPTVATRKSLGRIVGVFKTVSSKQISKKTQVGQVWQRNYYERIIRNENELIAVRQYIRNNPSKWESDVL